MSYLAFFKLTNLVMFNMSVVKIVFLYHTQQAYAIYSLYLSLTICVSDIPSLSVSDSLCLSQTVSVYHRQSLSVTDSCCLSHFSSSFWQRKYHSCFKASGLLSRFIPFNWFLIPCSALFIPGSLAVAKIRHK